MTGKLARLAHKIKGRITYCRLIYSHRDTPWYARALLWVAIVYAVSPIDLIPDFIPVLGYLDDVLILPILVGTALWLVPAHVRKECRELGKTD